MFYPRASLARSLDVWDRELPWSRQASSAWCRATPSNRRRTHPSRSKPGIRLGLYLNPIEANWQTLGLLKTTQLRSYVARFSVSVPSHSCYFFIKSFTLIRTWSVSQYCTSKLSEWGEVIMGIWTSFKAYILKIIYWDFLLIKKNGAEDEPETSLVVG